MKKGKYTVLVLLRFACPTRELKDYSAKPLKLKSKDCKRAKSDEGKKEAADLVAYSLSIDTYITNTEKESKLRKTDTFFHYIRKVFMI